MVASIQLRGAVLSLALAAFTTQLVEGCNQPLVQRDTGRALDEEPPKRRTLYERSPPPMGRTQRTLLALAAFTTQLVEGCKRPGNKGLVLRDTGRALFEQPLLELNELSLLEDETLWQHNKAKCASEAYDVSLFIYHHLALVASPVDPSSDCLAITFDVVSDGKKLSTHKRVIADKQIIEKDYLVKSSMLNIDQRNFGDITDAFELMVDLGASGDYDVMDNNCAKYLLETGKLLNITPMKYPKIVKFTKKRLGETGTYIAEGVRNHPDASMYFDGATGEEISDDTALDVVVQYNIDKHA